MSNAAVSRYSSFITMLELGKLQMCGDVFIRAGMCVRAQGRECRCGHTLSSYLLISSTYEFLCRYNTACQLLNVCLLGVQSAAAAERFVISYYFSPTPSTLTLRLQPALENASRKASLTIMKFHIEEFLSVCVCFAQRCLWYVCAVCISVRVQVCVLPVLLSFDTGIVRSSSSGLYALRLFYC